MTAGYADQSRRRAADGDLAGTSARSTSSVSILHGFVVYDFKKDKVTRAVDLPNAVARTPRSTTC